MKRAALLLHLSLFLAVILAFTHASHAQLVAGPGVTDASSSQPVSNRTFSFSGTIPGQLDGALSVTFSIYADQQSATALWTETQLIQIAGEKYSVILGSTSPTGLPVDIFSADQAHWLGVQVNGAEKRFLLVSVPYAMKAVEAERLGGLLPSDYVTVQQLQSALQSAAGSTSSAPTKTTTSGPTGQAAAAGTTPQPATDFTDNNTSEVLLVTQQGTGYAIHAITSSQAEAILAQNDSIGGTALHALATNATGASIGVLAETASPNGIAGVFNSQAGGKILSLRNNGIEVAGVDANGNLTTNGQVQAQNFIGSGAGLTNISPSAINATPNLVPNTVVQRDGSGSFGANIISARTYFGDGSGLLNIPPTAINATPNLVPSTVVLRDGSGSFGANIISAGTIFASNLQVNAFNGAAIQGSAAGSAVGIQASTQDGIGLWAGTTGTNFTSTSLLLTNSASGKLISGGPGSSTNINETFSVSANGDIGFEGAMTTPYDILGTWIPSSLVKLTSTPGNSGAGTVTLTSPGDTSGAIGVAFGNGTFSRVQVVQSGQTFCGFDGPANVGDYVGISKTVAGNCADIGASFPTDGQQVVGRVLSASISGAARILLFQSELHSAAGAAGGSITINTGAGLTGGPITSSGTISVADGGITAAKLAPNAVTSANIADGSLTPAKIAGTAATLGVNTFSGTQTMPSVNVGVVVASGNISAGGGSFAGPTAVTTVSGTALAVSGGDSNNPGLTALNQAVDGIALQGTSTGNNAIGVLGRAAGGQSVAGLFVNSQGNGRIISAGVGAANGSEVFSVDTAGNVFAGGAHVAQFSNSSLGTTPAGLAKLDANGLAVSTAPGDTTGAVGIVVSNAATFGPVRIAYGGTAFCVFDSLPHILDYVQISRTTAGQCSDVGPTYPTSGQVIGRVTGVVGAGAFVLLSGPNTQLIKSGVLSINTGSGLAGGPITSSGTISIANAGVTNSMLQNSSVTVTPGAGLSGGGAVPLGGSVTLSNTGALSFNGRSGNVLAAAGDYSFAQIAGTAGASQLPAATVYNNQSNTFTTDQTIQGNLAASGNINAGGSVTATALSGTSANLTGAATPTNSVLAVNDTGASGSAISVNSANNPAALFISGGPTVFMAGKVTGATTILSSNGDLTLNGTARASAFSGDGSALTNVSAAKIGTLAPADIATNAALSAETTARQSADTTLQSNLTAESSARASADTSLQASIAAETSARQSDISNLQTNINNVSAADAKLAASNTFTAGTQDFSGAAATLPVHAVLSANTPAACVASEELLIKTDAPAGQQLFICNATANGWNLVGDGAANGVSSFNGRNGSVVPASGDYSFAQISGSATAGQLPLSVVYNSQSNTFTGNQTVNGSVTATSFSGSGSGVTGVNAASLNGIPSNAFAQLHAINSFTSEQAFAASTAVNPSLNIPAGVAPATPLAGDVWNTGSTLQYRDSASTTRSLVSTTQSGGLQLLKLTTSITPTSVTSQACTEQNFTVSGISSGDVLLGVAQPSTSSPGTNIAIGGFRVSAANTVAVQFCNVSRNNSTPTAGVYTFALMR